MVDERPIVPIKLNPEIPRRAVSGGERTLSYGHPCPCYRQTKGTLRSRLSFHSEMQDAECDGWKHLLELIERAAVDKQEEFNPLEDLPLEERRQIVTLPPSIAKLTHVRNLNLYDSALVRIPPQIGEMASLETFTPYTSYRLHWFPYEITRCKKLTKSTVSTRAIYGNYHFRPPFPELQPDRESIGDLDLGHLPPGIWGADAVTTCSVCNRPLKDAGLHQVWISLWVAAYDVLPLLVNACSRDCIRHLPTPPKDYVQGAHKGGLQLRQPPQDPHYAH